MTCDSKINLYNNILKEHNNKLWEHDIILREQNMFFFSRMALISHRTFIINTVFRYCFLVIWQKSLIVVMFEYKIVN